MNKQEFIKENYDDVCDGETRKGCCGAGCWRVVGDKDTPSQCHLNVTRDGDTLVYNCFGAKCSLGGGCASSGGMRRRKNRMVGETHKQNRRAFSIPHDFERNLNEQQLGWLAQYGIGEQEIVKYDIGSLKNSGAIMFPIREKAEVAGYVSRTKEAIGGQKWQKDFKDGKQLIYKALCPESSSEPSQLIIVESAVSSIMVGRENDCIALLGTTISDGMLKQIQKLCKERSYASIVLWLDPDVPRKRKNKLKFLLTKRVLPTTIRITNEKPHEFLKTNKPHEWLKEKEN